MAEFLVDIADDTKVQQWVSNSGTTHIVGRIVPSAGQPQSDCNNSASCSWPCIPHHLLVDLSTMQVVQTNCLTCPEVIDGQNNGNSLDYWNRCIGPYLP